jgi:predicted Zn-dependent protease
MRPDAPVIDDGCAVDDNGLLPGSRAIWAICSVLILPGRAPDIYPQGTARLIKAGSSLNFQIHYSRATGKIEYNVKAVIDTALKNKLIAAGFIQRSSNAVGVGNKAGLFGYHTYTDSSLTHTMRTQGGTSSGGVSQSSVSAKDLNGETEARIAAEKCVRGVNRKKLEPAKYTVILEPAAVGDLIGWLGFSFGARDAEQGPS